MYFTSVLRSQSTVLQFKSLFLQRRMQEEFNRLFGRRSVSPNVDHMTKTEADERRHNSKHRHLFAWPDRRNVLGQLQENHEFKSFVIGADVARSHGGDGGGDDRPPSHVVPTGCGGCFANKGKGKRKPNLGGRGAGRLNTRDKTRNLSLKEIAVAKGPVRFNFEAGSVSLYYPSWEKVPKERKAAIISEIGYMIAALLTSGLNGFLPLDSDQRSISGQKNGGRRLILCKSLTPHPTTTPRLLSRKVLEGRPPPPDATLLESANSLARVSWQWWSGIMFWSVSWSRTRFVSESSSNNYNTSKIPQTKQLITKAGTGGRALPMSLSTAVHVCASMIHKNLAS
ncbi:hypothetical protein Tco_0353344 [Tanacetum coccineum]